MTPAQVAGIHFPLRHWKDVTEQPYRVTARIPIAKPKAKPHKRVRAKCKMAGTAEPMLSLTQVGFKK